MKNAPVCGRIPVRFDEHQERGFKRMRRIERMHEQRILGVRRESLDRADPKRAVLVHPPHPPHPIRLSFLMLAHRARHPDKRSST